MLIYEEFPYLQDHTIEIRKMVEADVDALSEITDNDSIYKFIPYFLYKKSRGNLLAAIKNLGGRDFEKKKLIIAGIYLKNDRDHLIGLAEMFDYKKGKRCMTIGYKINETYWNQGIATCTVGLLKDYLLSMDDIDFVNAYVMPENIPSAKVLMHNGFAKMPQQKEEKNWGGKEKVIVDEFIAMI